MGRPQHLAGLWSPFHGLSSRPVSVYRQLGLSFLLATFKVFPESLSVDGEKS